MIKIRHIIFLLVLSLHINNYVMAKDYGVHGNIFLIKEEDFLEFIKNTLKIMEKNGTLKKIEENSIKNLKEKVNRPEPVKNLKYAKKYRKYYYDPSITLQQDYMDHRGVIFAKKGTKINPFNNKIIKWRNNLIFIDGDSKEHIKWALENYKKYNGNVKIILTNGPILKLINQLNLKLYFDQGGALTSKFMIENIPAIITREGDKLSIEEVVLKYENK